MGFSIILKVKGIIYILVGIIVSREHKAESKPTSPSCTSPRKGQLKRLKRFGLFNESIFIGLKLINPHVRCKEKS